MRILVTNIGRRVYFVKFLLGLKKYFKNLKIFLTDSNLDISALKIKGVMKIRTPKVEKGKTKYLNNLFQIVKKNKISLLIPCTNYDLKILSLNKNKFTKYGCNVMVSRKDLIDSCLDKRKLFDLSKKHNFYSPKIFENFDQAKNSKVKTFIKKLRTGHSSLDQIIIKKLQKKDFENKYIIQEYINGEELHLDILNDHNGKFISSCLKKKISMRFGETDIAKVINNQKIKKLSKNLSKNLKHIGNLDCDIIYDNKKKIPYIIDINPRFGGGYPFTHLSGNNFLHNYIANLLGTKFRNNKKNYKIYSKGITII